MSADRQDATGAVLVRPMCPCGYYTITCTDSAQLYIVSGVLNDHSKSTTNLCAVPHHTVRFAALCLATAFTSQSTSRAYSVRPINPLINNLEYHMQVRPRVQMRIVTKSTDVVHIATISACDFKSFSISTERVILTRL